MSFYLIKAYQASHEFIKLLTPSSDGVSKFEAFKETFLKVFPQCFSGEDPSLIGELVKLGMFNWAIMDTSQLARIASELDKSANDIERTSELCWAKCQSVLPINQDLSVCILPGHNSGKHVELLNGLSAAYVKRFGGIYLLAYPLEGWLEKLSYVLAHEYHHVAYLAKRDFSQTLLERVVAEGLADDFASRLFPDQGAPWMSQEFPLTIDQEIRAYNYLVEPKDEDNFRANDGHNRYLQGNLPDETMPSYTGFAIAYRLVQGFLSSQKISISSLLEMDPRDILEKSEYRPSRD